MSELFSVSGKTVLVTGASSGIGAHMATMFAIHGANVVLAARRQAKLDSMVEKIITNDGVQKSQVVSVPMDVNDRDNVEQGVQFAISCFGKIDVLINNAGIARSARLLEMSEEDWQSVIDTNLSSVWRVGQITAREMTTQKTGGVIINIASILGFDAQSQNANYGAAKSAVIHLTKSMALEWGSKGIRVNAIAPGYFVTDINRDFLLSDRGAQYLKTLFPRRAGQLSELEGPMLLLASEAGSYINGTVLTVDGGTLLTGA